MAVSNEEVEAFDKLIRVLEDALEKAAKILGPNARPGSRSRYDNLKHASQVYEHLSDLLDATRAGRSESLERQSN